MLLLLFVPAVALVTRGHRYLQLYAPSNVVIARARTAPARCQTALLLSTAAMTMLVAMHLLTVMVATDAPGWLNLIVLILAWDAIKLGLAAASVALRCAVRICRQGRGQSYEALTGDGCQPWSGDLRCLDTATLPRAECGAVIGDPRDPPVA